MKITNKVRRIAAMAGLGWCLADLLPPHPHFTIEDWIICIFASAIYVMSLFIKEDNAIR